MSPDAGPVPPEPPAPPAPGARPIAPLLVASLVLSAVSLLLPDAFGPIGPLVAGVLAFLGYRKVAASKGALRGPGIAKVAMTLALALLVLHAWAMVRNAAVAAAWNGIRGHLARVEEVLRTGTPEGAYALLSEEARGESGREAWVSGLRDALQRLGPLERLGEAREEGGDWPDTASFGDGETADLRLPLSFDAAFRNGPGRVEVEVRARRTGREVRTSLESLRVLPGPAPR